MLLAHDPSRNLQAPRRGRAWPPEDLADVHITVVPSTQEPEERPPATATPSGRSAAFNIRPIA